MTIVTIGFADFLEMGLAGLEMVFGASSLIIGGNSAGSLAFLVILMGILYTAGRSLLTQKLEIVQLIVSLAAFLVLFVPTMEVTVEDRLGGTAPTATYDVPVGVAIAGGVSSQAAMALSELYQTAFQDTTGADEPQLSMKYFAYPLRLMLHMRDIDACTLGTDACRNTINYHRQCIIPVQLDGDFPDEAVTRAPDEVYFKGAYGASEVANFEQHVQSRGMSWKEDGASSHFKPCPEAADDLQSLWDRALNDETSEESEQLTLFLQSRMGGSQVDLEDTAANQLELDGEKIRMALSSIANTLTEERNFLISQMVSNIQATAEAGYSRDAAGAVWMTQMLERQRVESATEASGFLRLMLIMMGLMQFLFIVLTPVIAIVALAKLGAGFKVYGGWLLLAVWSSSFLIVATVIDFWARHAVRSRFTDNFEDSTIIDAMSLPGLAGVYNHVSDTLMTANQFLAATPIVTLVLLTGSIYPLASMANRLAGAADMQTTAGTTGISDPGAAKMGSQLALADNNPYLGQGNTMSGTTHMSGAKVTFGQDQSTRQAAADELRNEASQSYEHSFTNVLKTANQLASHASDENASSEQRAAAISVAEAASSAVGLEETLGRELQEQEKMELAAKLSGSTPAKGIGKFISGLVSASFTDSEIDSDKVNEIATSLSRFSQQTEMSDELKSSYMESLRHVDSASFQEEYQHAQQEMEKYQEAKSRSESVRHEQSGQTQISSGATLTTNELQSLDAEIQEQSNGMENLAGFLQRHAEAFGDDGFMQYVEERGGLIDESEVESTDEAMRTLMNLQDIYRDPDVDPEYRYYAATMMSEVFRTAHGVDSPFSVPEDLDVDVSEPGSVARGGVAAVGSEIESEVDTMIGNTSDGMDTHQATGERVAGAGFSDRYESHNTERQVELQHEFGLSEDPDASKMLAATSALFESRAVLDAGANEHGLFNFEGYGPGHRVGIEDMREQVAEYGPKTLSTFDEIVERNGGEEANPNAVSSQLHRLIDDPLSDPLGQAAVREDGESSTTHIGQASALVGSGQINPDDPLVKGAEGDLKTALDHALQQAETPLGQAWIQRDEIHSGKGQFSPSTLEELGATQEGMAYMATTMLSDDRFRQYGQFHADAVHEAILEKGEFEQREMVDIIEKTMEDPSEGRAALVESLGLTGGTTTTPEPQWRIPTGAK